MREETSEVKRQLKIANNFHTCNLIYKLYKAQEGKKYICFVSMYFIDFFYLPGNCQKCHDESQEQ